MKLSLSQKGPLAPPPVLAGMAELVSLAVQSWPGVIAATHWYLFDRREIDGVDFYVGDDELGHIHLDGEVHLATSSELSQSLISAELARPFQFGGSYASWCEFSVCTRVDVDRAIWLFRQNYDRITHRGAE